MFAEPQKRRGTNGMNEKIEPTMLKRNAIIMQ